MTSASGTSIQDNYRKRHDQMWSRSEKAIAHRVFDAALNRELHEVLQETKQMASKITKASQLWDLENYLTERRKEIDRKYDRRSSQLTSVLGRLVYEGGVKEEELRGLKEDKLNSIRSYAQFLAGMDAA
jgi:hypothetical protein